MTPLTHNQYIKLFSDIAIAHRDINSFYTGDLDNYTANESETLNPVTLWVVINDDTIAGKVDSPKYTFVVLDFVNQDSSNLDEVYSDTLRIAKDVLAILRQPYYESFFKIEEAVTFNPFNEKFDSDVAGWQFELTFNQSFLYDACAANTSGLPSINYETIAISTSNSTWGYIVGTLSNQTDLQAALDAKVPTSRTLTINGTTYDLSADRTWTISTGGETLAQTLVLGNTTGGTDLTISSGDSLLFGTKGVAEYSTLDSKITLYNTTSGGGLNLFDSGVVSLDGLGGNVELNTFSNIVLNATDITSNADILYSGGKGIDTSSTIGTDTLNIGATNADVINIGRSGATVNILGSALYEYAANQYVLDKLITLNYNGAIASGIGVGFEIEENSVITGYFKTNATRDGYDLLTPAIAYKSTLSLASLTADRIHTLPNVAGTIATVNGGQTFTSAVWQGTSIGTTYTDAKIKGSVGATAGLIAYGNGTADTVTTDGNFVFDSTNVGLIVGTTALATATDVGLFSKNQNAATALRLRNTTSGTAAQTFLQLQDGADALNFGFTNTSYTAAGPIVAKTGYIQATGTGGLVLEATNGSGGVKVTTGGTTVRAEITSGGYINLGSYSSPTAQRLVTIGNTSAWVSIGDITTSATAVGFYANQTTPSSSNYSFNLTSANTNVNAPTTTLNLQVAAATKYAIGANTHTLSVGSTTGSNINWQLTCANSTVVTASTAIPKVLFTLGSAQWSTGALAATQKFYSITQPAMSFVGASTSTLTSTVVIAGAVDASTNATITTSCGLLIESAAVASAGTVTTSYGAYINAMTGGGTNYALGVNGVSNFLGNVRLTQTVTTEAVTSDTTVTIVINGTTYKLLAKA